VSPQVRRFDDAAEFYEWVEPFLMMQEAQHCLMLGLCTMLIKTDTYEQPPYLACVEEGDDVKAVAMRTPPYNLILSEMADMDLLPIIADDVRAVYAEIPGVLGAKHLSKVFVKHWQNVSGQPYRLNREERIYELEQVQPVSGVKGEYRKPTEADREILIQWFIDFSTEALDGMAREDAERQVGQRYTSDPAIRGLRLWYVDGEPVSFVGYGNPTPNGYRVGPVYTPPEHRGKGYASACTAAVSQELLDRGCKYVFLFTNLQNPTSNHIYQVIGYEPVSDFDEYHFAGAE
jgi:uncharacterized protein